MKKKKKIVWVEVTRKVKPLPILLIDAVAYAFKNYFTPYHDGKIRIDYYRQAFGGRGYSKETWQRYINLYKNNENKIVAWMKAWHKKFIELKQFSEKVNKVDIANMSNREIKNVFEKFYKKSAQAVCFAYDYLAVQAYYPNIINAILKEKISDTNKLNDYIKRIYSLPKPILMHEDIFGLLKIAIKTKQKLSPQLLDRLLEKHASTFGYLGMYMYYGKPHTVGYYKKRLKNLLIKSLLELRKQLKQENARFYNNEKIVKKIFKTLKLTKKQISLIKRVRYAMYMSILCDEYYTYVAFKLRPFLFETARRFAVSYNQLAEMRGKEIMFLFNKGFPKKMLDGVNARLKDHVFLYEKGKVRILIGKELEAYKKPYLKELKRIQALKVIKGDVACPGKVRGKVQIIKSVNKVAAFKKGKVLVTGTTMPQYVPAMKKSIAIITDEGGALSHAAIMSREFKKPCIIGTQIGTRSLKNGDKVEVDAYEGIVKKL